MFSAEDHQTHQELPQELTTFYLFFRLILYYVLALHKSNLITRSRVT